MIYERTFIRFFRECLAQVDSKIPLQERVFFVGISASNLMESLTTRYPMAVKELKRGDLESYQRDIGEFYAQIVKTWNKFNQRYELIKPVDELKKGAGEWVRKTFKKDVFPALQPMTVDKGKDLNLRPGLYLIVTTEDTKKDRRMVNYIEIPKKLPRHIVVDDKHFAVDVVDLIQNNLEFMFKDRRIVSSYPIIINRSAEIQLSQLSDLDPLDQVRATLKEREKSWITTLEVGTTDKKELKRSFAPREYHTSAGLRVLVGRNNAQNDQLTLKKADKRDIWLHAQKIHGSHVILCTNGAEADEQSLTEAAALAAYFSQARESDNVPVDYTPVKYVKKPAGARPGFVIYETYRTMYVTPEEMGTKKGLP